ncbi:GNAT family N-acetyltransferase [Candidatus Protofrankia californiensis]|uniref:GNAT family N-acetyltransferase n=1 Tax=Candidatus Protofrankia californiensis TaxID=1839754 RepID=UPI003204929F
MWGLGLATEAGAAVLEFAFTHVGADEVISLIHPGNAASIRVAGKLGLTDAHRTFRGDAVYAIARQTWVARGGG